jgi:hypothetical protein
MKKVVSLVERDGRARSFHVANIHANTCAALSLPTSIAQSTLMTDDARFYWAIGASLRTRHRASLEQRVQPWRRPLANTAENFFSILKRGVIGTYHHWSSAAHSPLSWPSSISAIRPRTFPTANVPTRRLLGSFGKRLTYRRTAALAA